MYTKLECHNSDISANDTNSSLSRLSREQTNAQEVISKTVVNKVD